MMRYQSYLEVESFMQSPEYKWFEACMELIDTLPDEHLTYESLLDGVFIHRLFCRMNIHVKEDNIKLPNGVRSTRRHNLKIIFNNIRHYYEHEMDYVIIKMPNIERLVKDPERNTDEAACLLNLLIGCAQLCPEKELFAESFHKLQYHSKDIIHQHTRMTSKFSTYVFDLKMLMLDDPSERENNAKRVFDYIRDLHKERDALKEFIRQRCVLPTPEHTCSNEDLEFSLQDVYCALNDAKFNNPISEYSVELSRVKDQERALRVKVGMLKDSLHQTSAYANDLKTKNAELVRINHDLEMKAREAQYYQEVAEMLSIQSLKVKHLMSYNKQLMYKIEELKSYKRQAEYLHGQNEKLLDANQDIDSRYTKFREQSDNQIKDLMNKNNELKKKLKQRIINNNNNNNNNSNDESENSNSGSEVSFEDSLEALDNAQEMINKNRDLESKLEKAQVELTHLKAKINSYKLVFRDFEIKKKELDKLNTEADRLRSELAMVSEERERLLRKYVWLKKKHRQLIESHKIQENELLRSQDQLTNFQKQASELEARCEEYRKIQEELMNEKKELMESNDELRRQNKEYADKWMTEFKTCQIERDALMRTKERLEQKIIDQFQNMHSSPVKNTKKAKGKRVREVLERIRRHSAGFFLKGRSDECGDEVSTTFAYTRVDDAGTDKDSDFVSSSEFFLDLENQIAKIDAGFEKSSINDFENEVAKAEAEIIEKLSDCKIYVDNKLSAWKNKRVSDVYSNYFGQASQKFWKEDDNVKFQPFDCDLPGFIDHSNLDDLQQQTNEMPSSSGIGQRPSMPRPLPPPPIQV